MSQANHFWKAKKIEICLKADIQIRDSNDLVYKYPLRDNSLMPNDKLSQPLELINDNWSATN